MTDVQSYIFDIEEVPRFFDDWNLRFNVNDMDGVSNNFKLVFSSYAPDNIEDCLNGGVLSSEVTVTASVNCCLNWDSSSRIISIKNDTVWNIGTSNNYPLKAVFLCKSDNYVLGYCIHTTAFNVTNKVKIEDGTILWSITNG